MRSSKCQENFLLQVSVKKHSSITITFIDFIVDVNII